MASSDNWYDDDDEDFFNEECIKNLQEVEHNYFTSSQGTSSNGGTSKSSVQNETEMEVEPVPSTSHQNSDIDKFLMETDGKPNYEHILLDSEGDNSIDDPDFVFFSEESDSSEYSTTEIEGRPTRFLKNISCSKEPLREIQNKSIAGGKEISNNNAEKIHNKNNNENFGSNDKEQLQTKPKRTRQKRKKTEIWADNQRKRQRNSGLEYTNRKGKKVEKRSIKELCNVQTCVYNCKMFTEDDRSKIFFDFWRLGDLRLQREYVVRRVTTLDVGRSRVENSKRKQTNVYTLKKGDIEYRVCKKFFLSTLDVSEKMVRTSLSQYEKSDSGVLKGEERGKASPKSKYSEETINLMLQHINSFPRVPAHWCRKDTKKEYLESILNRERMYSLYLQFCEEKNAKPVCKTTYKETLIKLNIGFHVPRKDQCWCHEFELLPPGEKEDRQAEYDIHTKRKNAANNEKDNDAKKAASDPTYLSANFDLEAVLYCPLKYAKPVFYKRKLASYNFTVYTVGAKEGFCFFWDETTGNRGSIEVASCLFKYIAKIESPVTELSLFSDCCPGQNRNSIVVAMLRQTLSTHSSLKVINLKFLEPGHTHMECDSMHATIETASQFATVYCPRDWLNVIKLAKKKGKPYTVKVMQLEDFWDFKALKKNDFMNTTKAVDGSKLSWGCVKWIRLEKDKPYSVFFKNEFWDSEFKELNISLRPEVNSKEVIPLRKKREPKENEPHILKPAYTKKFPLDEAKIKDLREMCKSGVIPKDYHPFYQELETIAANSPKSKKKETNKQSNNSDKEDDLSLAEMKRRFLKRKSQKKK